MRADNLLYAIGPEVLVNGPQAFERRLSVLVRAWERLVASTSCAVCVGAEIEFYLGVDRFEEHPIFLEKMSSILGSAGILIRGIVPEIGRCQYEAVLYPSSDPVSIAQNIEELKAIAAALSTQEGHSICFTARPYILEPPSALHINVSLVDQCGRNVFGKRLGVEVETELMQHSIAGLCALMNASMQFFVPSVESYMRFTQPFKHGPYKFANAPSVVTWGGDNRTVAIRIPSSSADLNSRHLEHRVPSSDADPALAIASVFAGMSYGIEQLVPLRLPKVWGDAVELEGCEPLLRSLQEANRAYESCLELQARMGSVGIEI